MKKVLLLFVAFALVTGLSACDMFSPEVVEEISEEYCRDNPDSEICQGDAVGDLEDEAIINVFNIILEEYNDTSQTTFCEDYFSVTNIELLDACRASRNGLFPEDVSGFSIESVTKKSTLSNIDLYEVVVLSPTRTTTYTFEIGLTKVEGIMYINAWSFTTETIDPTTLTVSDEDAEAYFEQFLLDYADDNISSTTICATYFEGDDATECVADRDESIDINIGVTLQTFVLVDGKYQATIVITSDEDDPFTEELVVTFAYNNLGAIVMTIHDNGEEPYPDYSFEDYEQFVRDLFDDFFYSNDPVETICSTYFIPEQYDFCSEGYANKEAQGYVQDIVSFTPYMDHYLLVITTRQILDEPPFEEMEIEVWVYETDEGLKLEFKVEDNPNPDIYDQLYTLIDSFIDAYFDPAVSDNDAVDPYIDPSEVEEMKSDRQEVLDEEVEVVLLSLYRDDDGQWFIDLQLTEGGETEEITLYVHVTFIDDNQLRIILDDHNDYGDYETFYTLVVEFLDAYNNPSLSNNDAIDPYIDPALTEDMKQQRQELILDGIGSVTLVDFYLDDMGQWKLVVDVFNGTDTETDTSTLYFYMDENNELKISFDQHQNVDFDPYVEIEHYLTLFQDFSIPSEEFCNMFVNDHQFDPCMEHRETFDTSYQIQLLQIEPLDEWSYIVFLNYNGPSDYQEEVIVHFYYNEYNELRQDWIYYSDDFNTYENLIHQMIDDFQNLTLSDDTFCSMYFEGEQYDMCLDRRANFEIDYYIDIADFSPIGGDQFQLVLLHHENDFEYYDIIIVSFYAGQSGELRIMYHYGDPGFGTQRELLERFLQDVQDNTISTADLCTTYFVDPTSMACYELRELYNDMYSLVYTNFFTQDDRFFDITIELKGNGELIVRHWFVEFVHDDVNNVWRFRVEDIHQPIDWESAQLFLDQFVGMFNDPTITDDAFVQAFALPDSSDVLYELRATYPGQRIVYYWLNEEYGHYWMEVKLDDEQHVRFDLEFKQIDGQWYADFYPAIIVDEITHDQVWNLAYDMVTAIQNSSDIPSICINYFGLLSIPRCQMELQSLTGRSTYVELSTVWQNQIDWTIELQLTLPGESYEWVQWQVFVFVDENGALKMDYVNHEDIPKFEKETLLQNFVVDFNDFSLDANTLCGYYFLDQSIEECIALYTELQQTNYHLNLQQWDFYSDYGWIEFLVYDYNGVEQDFYIQYDAEFMYLPDSNELRMNLWNPIRFTLVTPDEAETALINLFAELNDTTTSDDAFCEQWGHLFADCYYLRSNVREGSTIAITEWSMGGESDVWLHAQRILAGDVIEDYYFHLTIKRALDDSILIWGWQETDNPVFTLDQINEAFSALLYGYFDSSITDEQFMDQFTNGYHFPGIEYRQRLLDEGITIFYEGTTQVHNPDGYLQYLATIIATTNGNQTTHIITFDAYLDDNNNIWFNIMFDWDNIDPAFINTFLANLALDFTDETLSNSDFCMLYFGPYEDHLCLQIREEVFANDWSVTAGLWNDEGGLATFDLVFTTNMGDEVGTITYELFINFDVLGRTYIESHVAMDYAAIEAAEMHLYVLLDALQSNTMTLADFCNDVACNDILVPNNFGIQEAYLEYIYNDYNHVFNPIIGGEIHLQYNDGSFELLRFEMTYTIVDGEYIFDIAIVGRQIPVPLDGILLDVLDTEAVLQQFMLDLLDDTVGPEELCNRYFGGSMMDPNCIEDREMFLTQQPTITISPAIIGQDEMGMDLFVFIFTFDFGTETEEMSTGLRIYDLGEGQSYLEFIDYYTVNIPA